MPDEVTAETKIYTSKGGETHSLRDLLSYFQRKGTMRVSDLHIKVGVPPLYRIDGNLRPLDGPPLDVETSGKFIACLLSDTERERLAERGSAETSFDIEGLQFRVSCFRDNDGPCAAIRALDSAPPPVEQIGFPNNVWQDIVSAQQGLVLVTGITGAGKSTTIASLICRIAEQRACRIITLEDPIEYRLQSRKGIISQREVGRDVRSFKEGLRDALREDPDVIFVGEMRDRDSTSWTLTAAETGHLVFSTLHTRDTRGTLTRLLDMFPPNRQDEVASQVSLGLRSILCQKLVPRADGAGRVVAMEILNNTYSVANLIRLMKMEQIYTQLQTRTRDTSTERMISLEQSLARLVATGVITPLEAERWANDRNAFQDAMQTVQQAMQAQQG